jgi:CheY-like chemotaxis protein
VALAEDDANAHKSGFAGMSHSPNAETAGNKKRIVVVDDDRAFLELAERLLIKEGFSALPTNNPKGVLQLARSAKPDVILLDLLMPDLDGWAVLKQLKRDPITARIPVIILSVIDSKKQALDAGAHAIVAKPIDRAELLRAVKDACLPAGLRSRRARVTAQAIA